MLEPAGKGFSQVVVVGCGAVGAPLAALLSERHRVVGVERGQQLAALQEKGVRLEGAREGVFRFPVASRAPRLEPGALVFLCTKAVDTRAALAPLRGLWRPDTVLCLFQNGLGIEKVARQAAGPVPRIVRAVVRVGAEALEPGVVRFSLEPTTLPDTAEGRAVAALLADAGVPARTVPDFARAVWEKAIQNCVYNPLSALLDATDREVASPALARLRRALYREAMAVAEKEGVAVDPALPAKTDQAMEGYDNHASMHQDLARGRKTEIAFLNGFVAERARVHGLAAPLHEALAACIRFLEARPR